MHEEDGLALKAYWYSKGEMTPLEGVTIHPDRLEEALHPERKTERLEKELAKAKREFEKARRESVEARTQQILAQERLEAALALLTELAGDASTIDEAVTMVLAKREGRDWSASPNAGDVRWPLWEQQQKVIADWERKLLCMMATPPSQSGS